MLFDSTTRPKISRNKYGSTRGGGSGSVSIVYKGGYTTDGIDSRYVTQADLENYQNYLDTHILGGVGEYDEEDRILTLNSSLTVMKDLKVEGDMLTGDILPQQDSVFNIGGAENRYNYVYTKYLKADEIVDLKAHDASIVNADINNLHADKFEADEAHFFSLIIDEVKAAGGQIILSHADFKVDKIVNGNDYQVAGSGFERFYENCTSVSTTRLLQKAQNSERKILNKWSAGDLCLCQTFNIRNAGEYENASNKKYWKMVFASGYVTLDNVEYIYIDVVYQAIKQGFSVADGVGSPDFEVGDELVACGNRKDTSRQNAIIISAYRSPDSAITAPSIVQYKGINNFSFENKSFNVISANGNTFRGNLLVENGSSVQDLINAVQGDVDGISTSIYKMMANTAYATVNKSDVMNLNLSYNVYKQDSDSISLCAFTTDDGNTILVRCYSDTNSTYVELGHPRSEWSHTATISNYHNNATAPKHYYVELVINGNVVQRDVIDVKFDAGAILSITNEITAAVQDVSGNLAKINVSTGEIKASIYNDLEGDLKETGIDIKTGVITLKADKTEIEGNRLYLWDDEAGFIIGDANKKDVRIQVLNNDILPFVDFGGRQYCNHDDLYTRMNYGANYEYWTPYFMLGNYLANTNIVTEPNVNSYIIYYGHQNSDGSGNGGSSNSDSYSRNFQVIRYIYKVGGTETNPTYSLKYTSSTISTATPSNSYTFTKDFAVFKQKVEEKGKYAVRFKIKFLEACKKSNMTQNYYNANIRISFYYNNTDIMSKSIIAKNGMGMLTNAYNRIYFGAEKPGSTTTRFDVKVAYNGYGDENSEYSQRIDMTPTHLNLRGNVNIVKTFHDYNNAEHYGDRVYVNGLNLDKYDIVLVSSGQYNQIQWLNSAASEFGQLCGRTKRIYVAYDTVITAPRGDSKYKCYCGGAPFTLRQAWYDGTDNENSSSTAKFINAKKGDVYDITILTENLYSIVKVV